MSEVVDFTDNIIGGNTLKYKHVCLLDALRNEHVIFEDKFNSDMDYNGNFYRIKFIKNYRYECFSEYIGCHMYNLLGCETQETLLGVCEFQGIKVPVIACKYLTGHGDFLYSMTEILDREYDTNHLLDFDAILRSIQSQKIFDRQMLVRKFWEMFIIDLYISNNDRYGDNWSVIYNCRTGATRVAPVFDCGASLFSWDLDLGKNDGYLVDCEKLLRNTNRILKDNHRYERNDKQIYATDYLLHTDDRECLKTLVSISKRIDEQKINAMIDDITLLTEQEKNFYKTVLHMRKIFIIDRILHENVFCKAFL